MEKFRHRGKGVWERIEYADKLTEFTLRTLFGALAADAADCKRINLI